MKYEPYPGPFFPKGHFLSSFAFPAQTPNQPEFYYFSELLRDNATMNYFAASSR